jgi:4-methyl-5(b-hydroxyethyl)-thiazole monophosphate biosynthesis
MGKSAIVLLAEGFEEIEAVTPADVLRRAGVEVTVAGLGGLTVAGGHGIVLTGDKPFADLREESFDAVILPGGMPGAANLGASEQVKQFCRRHAEAGRVVAAICAAPAKALAVFGLLEGKAATCYPGFEDEFPASATVREEPVVVDGTLVTSRGPGTALPFAYALTELLVGAGTAGELREAMQFGWAGI